MHKKIRTISWIMGILAIILLVLSVANYKFFHKALDESVNTYILTYGYLAVFLLILILEVSPQPFVSGLAPLASGMALGLADFSLFIVAIVAIIISGFAAYAIGVYYGQKAITKLVGKKAYDRYLLLVKKHGDLALGIMAFTPIPYFPVLAGAFKMDVKHFFTFGIFFRILHYLVFGYIISIVI